MTDIRTLIPAIAEIHDESLRDAVASSWQAVVAQSPWASLDAVPQSPVIPDRSLLKHVNEVNDRAIYLHATAVETFGLVVERDCAIATAILHDLDKPLLYRYDGVTFSYGDGYTGKDHGAIGAGIAREHGVPDRVTELVRVHSPFASVGLPGTPEGTIVHYADYIANDFASILMGVEPVHSAMRMVPKDSTYGNAAH
jgi:putative nucleotidyltransferase with HDIG domain